MAKKRVRSRKQGQTQGATSSVQEFDARFPHNRSTSCNRQAERQSAYNTVQRREISENTAPNVSSGQGSDRADNGASSSRSPEIW
jgi:hypothetical protein